VTNDENDTFEFVVKSIASFNRNADATTVFTSTDNLAHLNLITCEGVWNEVDGNYPDRLVVFTNLVSSNATIPTLPNTGDNSVSSISSSSQMVTGNVAQSPSFIETFVSLIQSSYATLLDGIITSVLLISIIFVLIKIITSCFFTLL
jgi:hypothetical protein